MTDSRTQTKKIALGKNVLLSILICTVCALGVAAEESFSVDDFRFDESRYKDVDAEKIPGMESLRAQQTVKVLEQRVASFLETNGTIEVRKLFNDLVQERRSFANALVSVFLLASGIGHSANPNMRLYFLEIDFHWNYARILYYMFLTKNPFLP